MRRYQRYDKERELLEWVAEKPIRGLTPMRLLDRFILAGLGDVPQPLISEGDRQRARRLLWRKPRHDDFVQQNRAQFGLWTHAALSRRGASANKEIRQ